MHGKVTTFMYKYEAYLLLKSSTFWQSPLVTQAAAIFFLHIENT